MNKKTLCAIFLLILLMSLFSSALMGKLKVVRADNQGGGTNSEQNSWPMFQHDPGHTGSSLSEVTASNQSQWQFKTQNQIWGAPALAYGTVYVGSLDHNIYALNSSTGDRIWNYQTGGEIVSCPVVDNSVVYVCSDVGNVSALNATTGSLIWDYQMGGGILSSPTIMSGILYVTSDWGIVCALNATTGCEIWNYQTVGWGIEYSPSSPAVDDGAVYFGGWGGVDDDTPILYALNASNGVSLWNFTATEFVCSPSVCNGVVYFGSSDYNVYAINATTGAYIWSFKTGGVVSSCPAIMNGVVFLGSEDGNVYALNAATGSKIWSYQTGNTILDSPALAPGVVYIGSTNNLYVLNATSGNDIRAYQIADPTSVAIAYGLVYVGSSDSNLYSFCQYGSLTSLNLSSNSASAGSSVTCTVEVSGANPTGTITWETSSTSGVFSSDVTTLNSGTSKTTYVDSNPGQALITAIYSGDAKNVPSNQTAELELLNPSLPTELSVVQSGTLSSNIVALNGTLINVDVRIDEAYSVWAYSVCINWTPSVLKLLKVTEGPYLDQAGNTAFLVGLENNTGGTIKGGVNDAIFGKVAASGSGVLFTLEFQAINSGNATVSIDPLNTMIIPTEAEQSTSIAFQVANASIYVVSPSLQWTAIDFFNEGKLDPNDFFYFVDAYIQYNSFGIYNSACDLNHDGKIDATDFLIFCADYIAWGQWLQANGQ